MEIVARVVKILNIISEHGGAIRFNELQSIMRLPSPSTLARLLKGLCAAGALKKDESGVYCLTEQIRCWGQAAGVSKNLQQLVLPELEKINREFSVSVIVFEYRHNQMYCVEKIADEYSPALQQRGVVLPLRFGLIGSYLIYRENKIPLDEYIAQRKKSDVLELMQLMDHDLETRGHVYDYGRLFDNNHRLAVPLTCAQRTVAVLGAGFMPGRAAEDGFIDSLSGALKHAALNIENAINQQYGEY